MNKFLKSWQLIALSVLIFVGISCNKEKDEPISKNSRNILIETVLPNPNGTTGSSYAQLIESIEPATYDNKQAIETSYTAPSIVRGQYVYILPGWKESNNLLKIYELNNNKLISKGSVSLPANSGANAMEIVGDKIYVSYSFMGKIGVLDKNSQKVIKEIDITSDGVGDKNPDPAQMIVRDEILYVALNQLKAGTPMPDPTRAKVDILLVNTKTDKPIKMITEETANMSMPTKPEADDFSMFIDEQGDIYINCISGFGFIGQDAGFLRIKKGETDFDKSYQFKITQTAIEGEANKASYVMLMKYAQDGIVYATVDIPAYYSKPPNWFEDRTVFPVKIDLKSKTIRRLGIPRSNNLGTCVGLYKDKVLFGLSTKTDNGFFVYDTKTEKMSDKAVIKTTGNTRSFLQLKE